MTLNTNKHWHVYTKQTQTGTARYETTPAERARGRTNWESGPEHTTTWHAETRLDNGARYAAGPCTSEAALRAEMADCERRWDTPPTTASGNPTQDECAANSLRRENARVADDLGLTGRPSFTSQHGEVEVA